MTAPQKNKKKRLGWLIDNIGLKLLAVVLALILWLLARIDFGQRLSL